MDDCPVANKHRQHAVMRSVSDPISHIAHILQLSCAVVFTDGTERPCCGGIRSQPCQQLAPFGAQRRRQPCRAHRGLLVPPVPTPVGLLHREPKAVLDRDAAESSWGLILKAAADRLTHCEGLHSDLTGLL